MTVPRSVAEMLDNHVVFELECIDRMYLNLYQPKLMYTSGVVGFFKYHRDMPFASGAFMDPISKEFVAAIHRYIADQGLDLVHFAKGQRKDDVAKAYLADHDGSEGVLFVGRARRPRRCRPVLAYDGWCRLVRRREYIVALRIVGYKRRFSSAEVESSGHRQQAELRWDVAIDSTPAPTSFC